MWKSLKFVTMLYVRTKKDPRQVGAHYKTKSTTETQEHIMNLELVSDKAALFFLDQFEEDTESTKVLLRRKIEGDNPTKEEWRGNANAYANANAIAYDQKTADYIIDLLGECL